MFSPALVSQSFFTYILGGKIYQDIILSRIEAFYSPICISIPLVFESLILFINVCILTDYVKLLSLSLSLSSLLLIVNIVTHRFSLPLAPEDPPINITATVVSHPNITSYYVIITWGPVVGRLNGKLQAYNIRWRPARGNVNYTTERIKVASSRRKRREINDVPHERIFEPKNLSIYTNYSVEVAAVTSKEGKYSDPVYFLSQEGGMR